MAPEDVTLRLGGDASGAKRAVGETRQELAGLDPAAASAAGGLGTAGRAAGEAGKGFRLGGSEAERMVAALQTTGAVAPELGASLSYLIQFAINPMTLGFGAAVLAVQGLAMAFRASAAETEEERRRIAALTRQAADAVRELEKLRRLRGEMTEQGASRARREQLAVAAAAGITEAEARQVLEAVPGASEEEAIAWALTWAGRPGEGKYADLTPDEVYKYFGGRLGGERQSAWQAEGGRRAAEDPTVLRNVLAAADTARRESGLGDASRLIADLETLYGWDHETAARMFRFAAGREGVGESLYARFFDRAAWQDARRAMLELEHVSGREFVEDAGEPDEWGPTIRVNVERYGGMQVNQYNAGNANPNVRADGQPRGPTE